MRRSVPGAPPLSSLASFTPFRHAPFARFWFARLFSMLGMQVHATAMGWQVYDLARAEGRPIGESAFLLGLIGLTQFAPLLLLSLIGGQAADRFNRKLIVLASYLGKAALAAALIGAASLSSSAAISTIFVVATFSGAINAFLPAASTSLTPLLVPREDLPRAIAAISLAFQFGAIAGPSLGGLLYGLGPQTAYGAAATLILLGAAMLLLVETPKHVPVAGARTLAMIREGLIYVRENKIVLGAISLDLAVVLLAGATALMPVFARDILEVGPEGVGILRSSVAVGAAIVAVRLAIRPIDRHVGPWMFGAVGVFGVATILFGLSNWLWLSAFALALTGAADMISVYVRQSLVQLATPDSMRGRVSAVSFIFISASNELGEFESGLVARLIGPVAAVAVGGAGAIGIAALWARLFPQLWQADRFADATPLAVPAPIPAGSGAGGGNPVQ